MKLLIIGLVVFLSLASFRPTQPIVLLIEGNPECVAKSNNYMIQIMTPGDEYDDQHFLLSGNGILLSSMGKNIFNGKVVTSKKQIVLSLSMYIDETNTKHVLTRKVRVCK